MRTFCYTKENLAGAKPFVVGGSIEFRVGLAEGLKDFPIHCRLEPYNRILFRYEVCYVSLSSFGPEDFLVRKEPFYE